MKKMIARVLTAALLMSMLSLAPAMAESDLREKKLVTLELVMMASAGKDGSQEVVDAINMYLEEKLNIHVNLTFISYGNDTQQTNLMLPAG